MTKTANNRRWRWWHAAMVGVAANAASALPAGYNGDSGYYETQLRRPPGAPPGWVFAPVWALNNVLTLWSNLRVANLEPTSPAGQADRRAALKAEGAAWVLFAGFSALFFGAKSPILGAVDTVVGLGFTVRSVAKTRRLDRGATLALIPRLLWLAFASYVSVGTALRSHDRVLGYHPLTDPPQPGRR